MDLLEQVDQPQEKYTSFPKSVPYKKRVLRPEIPQPDDPSIRHVPLSRGQVAIVDAHRYEWVTQWNWWASPINNGLGFYAVRNTRTWVGGRWKSSFIYLHKEIAGVPHGDPQQVDHENRNHLDDREDNLRLANSIQNATNKGLRKDNQSGYKGVSWFPRYGKWLVRIRAANKKVHIGYFVDKEEAARAYDAKAAELHGEFAVLNFPQEVAA